MGTLKRIKVVVSSPCALPVEIIEDILLRLPAKSLRRFQCVSRWSQALIASHVFQDAHFQRNNKGNRRRLFIKPSGFGEPFYAWQPDGGPVERIMSTAGRFPQGSIFPVTTKSCNGLVLLSCLQYQTHLVWNPSTGETLTLPDRTPIGATRCFFGMRHPLVSYGLGYCPATRQHKVVRIYCIRRAVPATVCEVFTLNESTSWRPAATKPTAEHYPQTKWRQGGVLCNGNLHFLQDDGDITTFNVAEETFGVLRPPAELQGSHTGMELTELLGCLCAFNSTEKWGSFQVWLLSDDNDENWYMIHCFDWGDITRQGNHGIRDSCWIAPLDIYRDESGHIKIMFGTGSCSVFTVDPSIGTPEMVFALDDDAATGNGHNNDRFPTIGLFQESLVRVGGSNTSQKSMLSASMQAWSEVLSRLPARAVGSLNQLCKGFRNLINTKHFAEAHLHRANLNKSPQLMFIDGKPHGFDDAEYFISASCRPPLIDDALRVVCSKPCHGLNTVSFANYDFVCNPVTGYLKLLPLDSSSMDEKVYSLNYFFTQASRRHGGDAIFAGRLGLGYELQTCRHVLVRLSYKENNYKLVCKMRYIDDLVWDDIDPPPRPIANTPPAHVNGKLHWLPYRIDLGKGSSAAGSEIVVLDVSTRKFELLQGPPCSHNSSEQLSIVELQELVCVTCLHKSTCIMEIWETKGNGLWSVRYNIELGRFSPEYLPELATPMAVDPKDGRILLSTGRALAYYDSKTMELHVIYHLGNHIKGQKFVPVLFQESLVNPRDPVIFQEPKEPLQWFTTALP
jgi:F-box interacting protein